MRPLKLPRNRNTAWACLLANLLVLPGLGSWLAGRVSGLFQMALAAAGFILTGIWVVWFFRTWMSMGEVPLQPGPYFWKALLGVGLFLFAWCWALITSILIFLESPNDPGEKGLPPRVDKRDPQ